MCALCLLLSDAVVDVPGCVCRFWFKILVNTFRLGSLSTVLSFLLLAFLLLVVVSFSISLLLFACVRELVFSHVPVRTLFR